MTGRSTRCSAVSLAEDRESLLREVSRVVAEANE